jgi:hypothetical protein
MFCIIFLAGATLASTVGVLGAPIPHTRALDAYDGKLEIHDNALLRRGICKETKNLKRRRAAGHYEDPQECPLNHECCFSQRFATPSTLRRHLFKKHPSVPLHEVWPHGEPARVTDKLPKAASLPEVADQVAAPRQIPPQSRVTGYSGLSAAWDSQALLELVWASFHSQSMNAVPFPHTDHAGSSQLSTNRDTSESQLNNPPRTEKPPIPDLNRSPPPSPKGTSGFTQSRPGPPTGNNCDSHFRV